ncbi:hypothetical protein HAD_15512 [Hyphomonas adhaerens MHS-3]|uniref:Uncharacterized protein n=1 Tax=Hyphomonas adhaerens MHS-3 TaxID=1280949 RepID=A0A069E6A8_9PROT|nr:hypothetical protein HAD_15512 [Hyphomonas adhaerens MHS-3]
MVPGLSMESEMRVKLQDEKYVLIPQTQEEASVLADMDGALIRLVRDAAQATDLHSVAPDQSKAAKV